MHVDCVKAGRREYARAGNESREFTVMLPEAIRVSRVQSGRQSSVPLVELLLHVHISPKHRRKKTSSGWWKGVKRSLPAPGAARSFMTIFGYTWSRVARRIRCCCCCCCWFPPRLRWKITWSVVRHLPRPFSFLPADRSSPIDTRVLKTSAERENSGLFFALFFDTKWQINVPRTRAGQAGNGSNAIKSYSEWNERNWGFNRCTNVSRAVIPTWCLYHGNLLSCTFF